MLFALLRALGFRSLSVGLNSVGSAETRAAFGEALRSYLTTRSGGFGEDDRRKLEQNPLRLFDSRDPVVAGALEGAPRVMDFLDPESRRHHARVEELLSAAGVPHHEAPGLVRGLDYYTRTVFEVVSKDLSAQDAILGGGRYDRLVESLGGPALPAVGFAIGEDRLLQVAPFRPRPRGLVFVLPQTAADVPEALRVAEEIRHPELCVEVDLLARGFKKGMARASSLFGQAAALGWDPERMFALFLGEQERDRAVVTVKRLASGEQETFPRRELPDFLRAREPA
jgi:histidyl-tRNA synthetase